MPLQLYGLDYQTRPLNSLELQIGNNVFGQCFGVKKNEKILIITDEAKLENEAAIFFQSAKNFSQRVQLAVMPALTHHAEEPEAELSDLMGQQDIILMVTSYSLSHTEARHKASEAGARIASLPGVTTEIITRTLNLNYPEIAKLTKKIAGLLTMAETARLTSPNGTDIVFSLSGRQGILDTGLFLNHGDFGNLPAGEAFTAPVEGQSQGVAVFDGAFSDILIDEPIKVTFAQGQAVKIEGGQGARQLEITLNTIGPEGRHLAELGVGTNKNCRLESSLIEVEKVWGTVHLAIGNNKHIGGEIDAPYHADGVILTPTLYLDDKVILKDGQFVA